MDDFTVAGALAIGLIGIAYLQKFDLETMMKFDGSKTEQKLFSFISPAFCSIRL